MKNDSYQLNETELTMAHMFDNLKIATLLLEPFSGDILYANPVACQFYEYTCDEMIRLNISQINPRPLADTLSNLQIALSAKQNYFKTLHKTSSGKDRNVGIYSGPIEINKRRIVVALIHDITDEKNADERLRSLSQAVEQNPASIVITDKNGKIEYVNPMFTRTTGYTYEEAIGQDPRILKTGGGNRAEIFTLWETILDGQVWQGEFHNRKKNGDDYWENASISPVFDENGNISKFVAVKEDITEKRLIQNRVEEGLRFNEAILATSPIGIITYKATGQCILANPAAGIILGASPEVIMKQNFRELSTWKKYGIYDIAIEAIEKKEPISSELFYVSTFGKSLWMDVTCSPFMSGGQLNLLFMFEDCTLRKKAESELQNTTDQMKLLVQQLEESNLKANLLRDMGEMLQVCSRIEEAFEIIKQFGLQLFPSTTGGVFMISQTPDLVEDIVTWGGEMATEMIFPVNQCWALRRGQLHEVQTEKSGIRCQHVQSGFSGSYLDIPMTVSGDLIGLVHIEFPTGIAINDTTKELAQNVAEHLSLSISNIKLRESLRNQSIRDPLTGVFNRRYMEESLEREIPRAKRRNTHVSIVMLDIDHFKKFNDTFGHDAGDYVLKSLSELFHKKIRGEDIICRFGGEEFVLILPDANLQVAIDRAEEIRRSASLLKLTHNERDLGEITISIGVSLYPDNGITGVDLLLAADKALYKAKSEGRNRVVAA